MKYYTLFLFTLLFRPSFGQVQKIYISNGGKYSDDPKKAVSYITIKKLEGDSSFAVNQYNMHDTLMISGFYKDAGLRIPHGKFVFYQKHSAEKSPKKITSTPDIDTNSFVKLTGYVINGKREGKWLEYLSRDKLAGEYNYVNDKLNGPFKNYYYDNPASWAEGTLVNDSTEGKFYIYNADALLLTEEEYTHDKLNNRVIHFNEALMQPNFFSYLARKLKPYQKQLSTLDLRLQFTIAKNGKIINTKIFNSIDQEMEKAIISTMEHAPEWVPATYDDSPVEQTFEDTFLFFHKERFVVDEYRLIGTYNGSNLGPHHPKSIYYLYNEASGAGGFVN
jgi:antitoxin component YwqK of YwqJK toxin-antitoxin module